MTLKYSLHGGYRALALGIASCWLVVGCGGDTAQQQTEAEPEATLAPAPDDDWQMYGKDYTNKRYSELAQVTDQNVGDLELVWKHDLNVAEAQECTPIMVNGTLYVSTAIGPKYVYALDAKTGEEKWRKEFAMPGDEQRYACCGVVNRAVTYAKGKILVGRLDGKLTALDAETGDELWTTEVVDYTQGSVITSPPLLVGDIAIQGFGAGEYGGRAYLSAHDINTGEQVWKTYTVPGEDVQAVAASWKGDSWKTGGGAAWYVGSYDPDANLVYWGTGNPSPWNAALRGPDTHEYGDMTNLYSTSTLALDPQTGEIKWHYQHTPYDAWDYDGTNELILTELEGQPVAMKADRNGFFYVLNRNTGKLISANNFVKANWATEIDLQSGRPVEDPKYRPISTRDITGEDMVFPSFIGGKNWQPMAYSPQTGLVYIPANNMGMTFETSEVEYQRGYFYLGAEWEMEAEGSPGEYIAWDPIKQEKVWSVPMKYPIPGGALTTAGNLVFFGGLDGQIAAYNAKTGDKLWEYETNSGVGAAPMTYAIDGVQYVAVLDGRPSTIPGFIGGDLGEEIVSATPAGGAVYVFAIGQSASEGTE